MREKILFFFILLLGYNLYAQLQVTGTVFSEEGIFLNNVKIYNTTTHSKATENKENGSFSIVANIGDNLAFIREGYERKNVVIKTNIPLIVNLISVSVEIEEVEISRLTGDFKKDANLYKNDKKLAQLKKDIGIPGPPEKPREKPPELGLGTLLDPTKLYKLFNGDTRRMKSLYQYEDKMELVQWLENNIDPNFLIKLGIPKEKTKEFLVYSFESYNLQPLIKSNNTTQIEMKLEQASKEFQKL